MRMILVEECSEVDTIECPLIIGLQGLYLRPSLATGHPHPDSFPEKKKRYQRDFLIKDKYQYMHSHK